MNDGTQAPSGYSELQLDPVNRMLEHFGEAAFAPLPMSDSPEEPSDDSPYEQEAEETPQMNLALPFPPAAAQISLPTPVFISDDDTPETKAQKFRQMVYDIYQIVTHKLYKLTASSLEGYFRNNWKISRAQVYRYLDAAAVFSVRSSL